MSVYGTLRQHVELLRQERHSPAASLHRADKVVEELVREVRTIPPHHPVGRSLGRIVSLLVTALGAPAATEAVLDKLNEIEAQHRNDF